MEDIVGFLCFNMFNSDNFYIFSCIIFASNLLQYDFLQRFGIFDEKVSPLVFVILAGFLFQPYQEVLGRNLVIW